MIRKIKLLICALLVSYSYANAQDCDISIRVLSPEESGLTKSAGDLLVKRIEQLSNSANFVVASGSSIAIVPKLTYLTKDVLAGPPTKYSLDFELSLYLIDVNTGAINEQMAYLPKNRILYDRIISSAFCHGIFMAQNRFCHRAA